MSDADESARAYFIFHAPPHLRPMTNASVAGRIAGRVLFRGLQRMEIPFRVGCVVVVSDIATGATGPSKFDQQTVVDIFKAAVFVTVVTRFDDPEPYAQAVKAAETSGGIAVVVETDEEHAGEWAEFEETVQAGAGRGLASMPHAGSA